MDTCLTCGRKPVEQPWLHNYSPHWVMFDYNARDVWLAR
jgi:hypothetical protein